MKANVGGGDKLFRIIIGLGILLVGLVLKSWWGLVGLVPLLTGIVNFCPLYTLLKMNTVKKVK